MEIETSITPLLLMLFIGIVVLLIVGAVCSYFLRTAKQRAEIRANELRFLQAGNVLRNAKQLVIVPGYGFGAAQAQSALTELVEHLEGNGCAVNYVVHASAGRIPGHMLHLLAGAGVGYDRIKRPEDIAWAETDVALVIGASDIVNAGAAGQSGPLQNLPVVEVFRAERIVAVKRGTGAGYSGLQNKLFQDERVLLLKGDATDVLKHLAQVTASAQTQAVLKAAPVDHPAGQAVSPQHG